MGEEIEIYNSKPSGNFGTFTSVFDDQVSELAEIRNPALTTDELKNVEHRLRNEINPVYIRYPWREIVLECVPEDEFIEIKTNRNKYLITEDEQKELLSLDISIAGMSVGSSILYGLIGSRFGSKITIADDDSFSTTNLNRVQATLLDVGAQKVDVAYMRAKEMDPFTDIKRMNSKISEQNLSEFITNKTSIIFEEIDDFKMKVILREEAKRMKVPFVMLTNLGDSIQIDVERYDHGKDLQPFLGRVEKDTLNEIKSSEITRKNMKELSVNLVEKELIPKRAIESLKDIGSELVGRPQLYGTVAMNSGIAPYLIRKIFVDDTMISGVYTIQLDNISGQ